MMTAAQAKEKTKERIIQAAKEFIINVVEMTVDEAISMGRFYCTVNLKGVPSPKVTGAEIVRQLQDLGFAAEHISCPLDPEGYINIEWEDNQ